MTEIFFNMHLYEKIGTISFDSLFCTFLIMDITSGCKVLGTLTFRYEK